MLQQILAAVDEYVIGVRDVKDFEGWLVSRLQGILQSGDETAAQFANELDADLIDLSEGVLDENKLRNRWAAYINRADTLIVGPEAYAVETRTGTGASTIQDETHNAIETLHFTFAA